MSSSRSRRLVRRFPAWPALVLIAALGGCGGGDDDHAETVESNAALTERIESLRAALSSELGQTVPSLSVLIETPDGVYFTSATDEGYQPVTPDTHFRFASNTKTFTAASVMKMHQDGWLRYTDLVTAVIPGTQVPYLPDTPAWAVPYKESITIRQLLQHSAGVFDIGNDPIPGCATIYEDCVRQTDPDHTFTSEELVSQVSQRNLSYFAPGEGHHYSNTGYTMLSEIVSRVYTQHAGQHRTWADYVRDHLTGPDTAQPLDVRFPDQGDDQALPEPRACGRTIEPEGPPLVECDVNVSALVAEGNGVGTMRQLNRWVRSLHGGRNELDASTVQLMRTDTTTYNPQYGLGTLHVENLGYGHNGATHGNLSLMLYDPESAVSVIVFLPLWDLSEGLESFLKVFNVLDCAGWRAHEVFGLDGQPDTATCPDRRP